MPTMQHNAVEHSEHYIPCFSAMPSAVVLHHHDQAGSTCTSIYTSNIIQPNPIIVSLDIPNSKHIKISKLYSCLLASHLWGSRRNCTILSFDMIYLTPRWHRNAIFLLFWVSPSQLRVPRQAGEANHKESKFFIVIRYCSHVSGQTKSDFELQKFEKWPQFPFFLKAIPSAITIINLVKESSTANVEVQEKII